MQRNTNRTEFNSHFLFNWNQPQQVLLAPQHSQFSFSFTSSSNVSSVFSDLSAFSSSSLLYLYTCAMNYSPIICLWQALFAWPIFSAVHLYCWATNFTHPGFSNPLVDNLNQCLLYQLYVTPPIVNRLFNSGQNYFYLS